MANEQNVQKLLEAIDRHLQGTGLQGTIDTMGLASFLASRGVLAPSALTGSDTKTAVHAALDYDVGLAGGVLPAVKGENLIAALERIAKG